MKAFNALRFRNFKLYWYGQTLSLTGTWIQFTALAWLVLSLSESPLAVGLVTTLQWTPVLLFTLVGGVLTDHLDRRRLILITMIWGMAISLCYGILVVSGVARLWHVYVLAFLSGLNSAISIPLRMSFAMELVPREARLNAVVLNSISNNGTKIMGPALAGILIPAIGIAPLFFINSLSFLGLILCILKMDPKAFARRRKRDKASFARKLADGFTFTRQTPEIFTAVVFTAVLGVFGFNFNVIVPLICKYVLDTGPVGLSILMTCLGTGSFAMALVLSLKRRADFAFILGASLFFCLFYGVTAASGTFLLTCAGLFCLGGAGLAFTTTANSIVQLNVPDRLRGRVTSLFMLFLIGSTPVGGLVIGSLSNWMGVKAALLACAFVCLAGVVSGAAWRTRSSGVARPAGE